MTFLNATLIFGVAAVSIPIVLHMIARREPKKVVFPSIRLLTKKFESNRSRMRVRRWWLLALRIAAIAAFALALARPAIDRSLSITWLTIGLIAGLGVALLVLASLAVLRGQSRPLIYSLAASAAVALLGSILWGGITYASGPKMSLEGTDPVAIAIVLDNAATSDWKSTDDDRIKRMQDLATWMVTRLPPSSRIAIIDRSAQPASFSLDVASAVSKIEQLKPRETTQPIARRIDSAARLVRTSELQSRQVLVVTDLAVATWEDALADAGLGAVLTEAPAVTLTLFDLGAFERGNRSLSVPKIADGTPAAGVGTTVSTLLELSDTGTDRAGRSVTAELQIYENDPSLPVIRDGKVQRPVARSVDRTSVRVAPGGSSNLLLTVPPLEVGTHHGLIKLVGEDPLSLDDTRYFTLRVLPPVPLLIVGDDENESRVLRLAVSEEFSVEEISFSDLPVIRLQDYPAILLIDPPRDLIEDDSLKEFVEAGGALFVSLGPSAGDSPLKSRSGAALVRPWRATEPGTFFEVMTPSHRLLAPLTDVGGGVPWPNFRVRQYWQVKPGDGDQVLVRFAGTEHPALIERVVDREGGRSGRWLTLTTPLPALSDATRKWNDLFSGSEPWPAFLLVRQIAEYLTDRGGAGATSIVGQPQLVRLPDAKERSGEPEKPRRLQMFPPGEDAAPIPLETAGTKEIVFPEVTRAGTHWLRGLGTTLGFSANLPDAATRLERITTDDLDTLLGPDAYTLAVAREDIELAESESQQRLSLHSPALFLALVVFLLEQVLGNRFYRGRATAPSSGVGAQAA